MAPGAVNVIVVDLKRCDVLRANYWIRHVKFIIIILLENFEMINDYIIFCVIIIVCGKATSTGRLRRTFLVMTHADEFESEAALATAQSELQRKLVARTGDDSIQVRACFLLLSSNQSIRLSFSLFIIVRLLPKNIINNEFLFMCSCK